MANNNHNNKNAQNALAHGEEWNNTTDSALQQTNEEEENITINYGMAKNKKNKKKAKERKENSDGNELRNSVDCGYVRMVNGYIVWSIYQSVWNCIVLCLREVCYSARTYRTRDQEEK